MEEMGMTDTQFKSFIRFLIKDLKAVEKEENIDKQQEQINEIIDILQQTLED